MYAVSIFCTIAGHSLRGVQQCPQTVGGEERETAIEQEPAGRFEEQDQVRLEELTKVHESLGSEDDSQRKRVIEMSRRVTLPTRRPSPGGTHLYKTALRKVSWTTDGNEL